MHCSRMCGSDIWFSKLKVKYILGSLILIGICDIFGVFIHFFEVDYHTKFTYPLDINMDEVLWEIKEGKVPSIKPINVHNYRFRIKNEVKCKAKDKNNYTDVVLLYVIKSAINNLKQRNAIRKSWGWEQRFSDVTIRRIFLLGKSETNPILQDDIDEEHEKYQDLVQADFVDTYYNNTIKTMMGFKWVVNNCPKAQFIIFADDDVYISTKNLLKFVRNPLNIQLGYRRLLYLSYDDNRKLPKSNHKKFKIETTLSSTVLNTMQIRTFEEIPLQRKLFYDVDETIGDSLYAGYVFDTSPMRHKPSKWYITLKEYPFSRYPPYVTAGTYVLSFPALYDMYYTSLYTKHFRFDDVFLGIVAKKCGISPFHNKNFYFWKKPYDKLGYADVIASHGYDNPKELQKVWEEQRSLGNA
ncbi:beta-1,3-galactosyltransferase brn-like [Tachypleus tridentatus]|uniref:beta-1,3-galactosyltransferase brn-like n=1 Tax=Tachypleus tridentatus TaxID=6853 RepID=UPI003FD422DF